MHVINFQPFVLQCESKKIPPEVSWQFFQNGWEFFDQILHAYYAFPGYARPRIFIQLPATLTTQFTSCAQNVHHRPKRTLEFSGIFPKQEFLVQMLHAY